MSNMNRIDVHHHFYCDAFTAALEAAGGDPSGWTIPAWTVDADRNLKSAIGVKTAILSITAPGPSIVKDPEAAAALARKCNEDAAAIRDSDPSGYGFFGSVPSLLDTDLALQEITYALDTLHADGIVLMSRYGEDNHYLGHADFIPIWQELNRRKTVVFIHPTHAVDTNLVNSHLPQPVIDYPHETGRTAIDLITNDRMKDIRDCKIILSHAGGTLPYLIYRVAGTLPYTPFTINKTTDEIVEDAQQFYFDTALSSNPLSLPLLYKLAQKGHVLFGSDFPNAPEEAIKYYTAQGEAFEAQENLSSLQLDHDPALSLFPRLASL